MGNQLQTKFQKAIALHHTGNLPEAKAIYEEILEKQPNHFDALHMLGVIAITVQQFELAVGLISRALSINKTSSDVYYNLGLALDGAGRKDQAIEAYEKAISINPKNFRALNNKSKSEGDIGRYSASLLSSGKAIAINPDLAEAYHNRGNALLNLKRLEEALASYDNAIALKPDYAEAYYNRGRALVDLKRLEEALASYNKAIALKPGYAEAYYNRGKALRDLKRLEEALASYDKAIALKPDYNEAYNNRGNALFDLKRLEEALASYDKAIALKPDYAEAYNNRGSALFGLNRLAEALDSYDKAIALKPDLAEVYNNRGNALLNLKRLEEALASYDKAIDLKPDYAEAYYIRGNALRDLKRLEEALASYDKAIDLKPDYSEAYYIRGNALRDLKRHEEALASYDKAIALKPDYSEAYNNRGNALFDLKRLEAALASYDKAIALKPGYAKAYNNRGNALFGLKRLEDALASFDEAIVLKPDLPEVYNNRGNALFDLKRLKEALTSFEKAIALKPDYEFLLGSCLHTKMQLCDWKSFSGNLSRFQADISESKRVTNPFPTLSLLDIPELQKTAARIYTEARYPKSYALGPFRKGVLGGKIRIGYFSSDFCNHPVSYLTAELFEKHDRERFAIYGFSFGPETNDAMRQRVSSAFDKFIDVRDKSDREIANLSREMGIDIAVDLGGYTKDSRTGIFAEGCAPIQLNYIGYPGTMGANYIDYVIADRIVIPQEEQSNFTEKVVYLPNSFQVNDSKRKISDRLFTKRELNLPESGFVFCCLNNSYKIHPATFDGWMRILEAVEGSVLWLLEDNPTASCNLRKEAAARGIDSGRLVFAERILMDDYLARYKLADLFLDTLPYNAGATASDALWAGLPVLTCMGKSFASRMAGSLLNAIELPELVTCSQAEYETKAIELATRPAMLQEIKRKLEKNRMTAPLFNAKLFARHIESAYKAMYDRYQAGLPPDVIEVPDTPQMDSPLVTISSRRKTFLHIGCGTKRKDQTTRGFNTDEWHELRLDIDEHVKPDIVGTIIDMTAVADSSVDAIFSSHNIEHLYPHEVGKALNEFRRVLKRNGFLVVTCPDLQEVCRLIADDKLLEPAYTSPAGPIAPLDILYGHRSSMAQGNMYMAHHCGFTERALTGTLRSGGFASVVTIKRKSAYDLWAVASISVRNEAEMRALAAAHFPIEETD